MKINLSVIIPVYEAQKTLVRTINSINNQYFSDKSFKGRANINYR
jgi:glycosyltransferase involved in cell wall biosynthesis